jgi:hypothetical protein
MVGVGICEREDDTKEARYAQPLICPFEIGCRDLCKFNALKNNVKDYCKLAEDKAAMHICLNKHE